MSRLRLIAGPNGSGKSSIFQKVKDFREKNQQAINTGPFVNSDLIEKDFKEKGFLDLKQFNITSPPVTLISDYLKISTFKGKYDPIVIQDLVILEGEFLKLKTEKSSPIIGMIVSDLVRQYLLKNKISFTMETVFSDLDKIEFMRKAIGMGYKVYLYFVSTEDPQINIKRVEGRVAAGGHNVPHDKIVDRYYRTMDNLYEAVKLSYRAYIFDNSGQNTVKVGEKDKEGTLYLAESVPEWLFKYLRLS